MSETNKVMSSLQFPNTDQPYQVQDARVPANPAPYQQLVTGGEGNWVAEDRLAWKAEELKEVMAEQTLTTTADALVIFSNGELLTMLQTPGTKLNVLWNGDNYSCVVTCPEGVEMIGAGNWYKYIEAQGANPSDFGFLEDTGEPFFLTAAQDGVMAVPLPLVADASFTMSVVAQVDVYTPIDSNYLPLVSSEAAGAVKVYNFQTNDVPVDAMIAAVEDFEKGIARIFWHGIELIYASINELTVDGITKRVLYAIKANDPITFYGWSEKNGEFYETVREPIKSDNSMYIFSASGKRFRIIVSDDGTLKTIEG